MYNKLCLPLRWLSPSKTTWTVVETDVQRPSGKGDAQHAPPGPGERQASLSPRIHTSELGHGPRVPAGETMPAAHHLFAPPPGICFGAGDVEGAMERTLEKLPGHEGRALGKPAKERASHLVTAAEGVRAGQKWPDRGADKK